MIFRHKLCAFGEFMIKFIYFCQLFLDCMIFTDQLYQKITVRQFPPRRIVSLVPSQTELLFYLGLEEEVVGITKFCVRPNSWFLEKTRIGGTKNVDIEVIRRLQPDLIIANKEENSQSQINELSKEFSVWVSDVKTLPDALQMITQIGQITNKTLIANELSDKIEKYFKDISVPPSMRSAAYFIWRNPYMVAGGDTFIHEMLKFAGFYNIFAGQNRYPKVDKAQLADLKPAFILLSSEPYPFKEKHLAELRSICPQSHVLIVDGELFAWYGSRLLFAVDYFKKLQSISG